MRILLAFMGLVLLAACASPRYYPATPAGEGVYYIAQTPPDIVHYDGGYYFGGFQAWGIYPWWGYTYYSPNFYPHYFSMAYPVWYGNYGWRSGPPYVAAPYVRPHWPAQPVAQDGPGARGGHPGLPGDDAASPVMRHQTRSAAEIRALYRDVVARGRPPLAPGDTRTVWPGDPVTMPPTSLRPYGGPAASQRPPVFGPAPTGMSRRLTPMEPTRPVARTPNRDRPAREP